MYSILDEINRKNDKYNNNITKIGELEKENDRLIAEICYTIKNSKNNILEEIDLNKDYLKMLPNTGQSVDFVMKKLSNDEIDISSAKFVIELLVEIEKHNSNISRKSSLKGRNTNTSTAKGLWNKLTDRFMEMTIEENCENDY